MTAAERDTAAMPSSLHNNPALQAVLHTLAGGRSAGRSFVVCGRAGMGTTSVLEAATAHARSAAMWTASTSARPGEQDVPFAAVHRLLRQAMHRRPAGRHAMRLKDILASPTSSASELADTAAVVVAELSRAHPALLTVDDGHLLDGGSRQVIAAMSHRLEGSAATVLVAGRSGRVDLRGLELLELTPLDRNAAAQLVDSMGFALTAGLRSRILAEAGGNAMALTDLPQACSDLSEPGADVFAEALPITARMHRSLGADLDDFGDDVVAALLAAALHPGARAADVVVVASLMCGYDVGVGVLAPALERTMLTVDERIRFLDPMMRAVLIGRATVGQLQDAHAAWELALSDHPHEAVVHAAWATLDANEVLAARVERSATQSRRDGDAQDALRRLDQAVRLSPSPMQRGRRLVLAGRAAYELGRPDIAEALLTRAERLGPDRTRSATVDAVRDRFSTQVTWSGTPVGARSRLAADLHASGEVDGALDLLPAIIQSLMWSVPAPGDSTVVAACLDSMQESQRDPRFVALLALVLPSRAIEVLEHVVVDSRDAESCRLVAVAQLSLGNFPRAADLLALAARRARGSGQLGLLAQIAALQGHIALGLGDWDLTESASQEAAVLARQTYQPVWQLRANAALAAVHALRGDPRAVVEAVAVERRTFGRPLGSILASTRFARAMALVAEQRWTDGFHVLAPLFDPHDPAFHRASAARLVGYLAETALHAGTVAEANLVIDRFRTSSDPSPVLEINMAFVAALLADDESAAPRFASARSLASDQWPWMRARLDLAHGMWLRRHRKVTESRVLTARACETFDLLGAVAWSQLARAELRAAGVDARPAGTPASGSAILTDLSPQELQIATLAASGLSNREIGQRLYLSPRTVGSHLYRLFPKLGVTSRRQLAERIRGM